MSLISFDDKSRKITEISNLIACKHFHDAGIDVSDLNYGSTIFMPLLERAFKEVIFVCLPGERLIAGDYYEVGSYTIMDDRFRKLPGKHFLDILRILDELPKLDVYWDSFRGEWPAVLDYQWVYDENVKICGLRIKMILNIEILYPEIKVIASFIKKMKEVLSN